MTKLIHFLLIPLFFTPITHAAVDVAAQVRFPVEKYILPNGLTVLLAEDHSIPAISYHTWFRIGSRDEKNGMSGIAHLFEHLMFKGAKRYDGKTFEKLLQANGATNNAFTTLDHTGYHIDAPSSALELIMDIESDRMENLQVTAANLQSERQVVMEERRMRVDNNVMGKLAEVVYQTSYKVHPYGRPIIGWMDDIKNITLEACQAFFKTYYSASNAVIVVTGDFQSAKIKKLIEKYYGHLPKVDVPRPVIAMEPEQRGIRRQVVQKDVRSETLAMAFHVSKAGDDDTYALDLLSNILSEGPSSRLHKRLVYSSQLASSADSFNYTPQHPGLFQIYVSLKPGTKKDNIEKILNGELWRLRNESLSDDEVQKAKNQVMLGYVNSLKTLHGKAEALELNEIFFANYEVLFQDLPKYNRVTPEDIKRVANKYLNPTQASIVVMVPKSEGGAN